MKLFYWLKDFDTDHNIKRMHEYFTRYAVDLGIKEPEKTVRKVLKDELYMTKNVYKILRERAKRLKT